MRRYGAKNATSGTRRTNSMSADRPSSFGSRECQIGLPTFGRNGRGLGQEGGPEKYNRHAHDNGFSCSNRKRIKSIPLVVSTPTASFSCTTTLSTAFVLNTFLPHNPPSIEPCSRGEITLQEGTRRGNPPRFPRLVPSCALSPPHPLLQLPRAKCTHVQASILCSQQKKNSQKSAP